MLIQHIKYPFFHTIIYDIFDENELSQINNEVDKFIEAGVKNQNDVHHEQLFNENKTISFSLDEVYRDERNKSNILGLIKKVYTLYNKNSLKHEQNPFLRYIPSSNADTTFLQLYKPGSSYFEHDDKSVVTFLYPFMRGSTGGDLLFTEYNYKPHLVNNCCLIFPSFELHRLEKVKGNKKDDVVRFSINQRIYINSSF